MHRPGCGRLRIARAPSAEQRAGVGQVLRFEKQLAERGMREVVSLGNEHNLCVAGHVDLANPAALTRERDPTHLDVVFRGNRDFQTRGNLIVQSPKHRALGAEFGDVVFGFFRSGLIGG